MYRSAKVGWTRIVLCRSSSYPSPEPCPLTSFRESPSRETENPGDSIVPDFVRCTYLKLYVHPRDVNKRTWAVESSYLVSYEQIKQAPDKQIGPPSPCCPTSEPFPCGQTNSWEIDVSLSGSHVYPPIHSNFTAKYSHAVTLVNPVIDISIRPCPFLGCKGDLPHGDPALEMTTKKLLVRFILVEGLDKRSV